MARQGVGPTKYATLRDRDENGRSFDANFCDKKMGTKREWLGMASRPIRGVLRAQEINTWDAIFDSLMKVSRTVVVWKNTYNYTRYSHEITSRAHLDTNKNI